MCHGGVLDNNVYTVPIAPYGSEPERVDNVIARESAQPPPPHLWTWAGYSTSNCIMVGGILAICAVILAVAWRIFLIRRFLRERGVRRDSAGTSGPVLGKEVANMELGNIQATATQILVLAPDGQPTWVAVSDCSSPPASAPSPSLATVVADTPSLRSSRRRPSGDAANADETPPRDRRDLSRAEPVRVSLTPVGDAVGGAPDLLAGTEAEPPSQRVSGQTEAGSPCRGESGRRSRTRRSGSSEGSPSSGAWVSNNCTGLGTNCRCVPCVVAFHTSASREPAEHRSERLRSAAAVERLEAPNM